MQLEHVYMPWKDGTLAKPASAMRPSAIMHLLRRLARSLQAIAEERSHRRAIRALQRFDNHLLADIGIKRCEIEQLVRRGRGGL